MKYKGIIFDLDGTLLNTIDDILDSINYALSKHHYPELNLDQVKYCVGSGAKNLIINAFKKLNIENGLVEEVYQDYMLAYNLWKANKTKPYDGVLKVLKVLKRRGIKLAVLSNKPHQDTLSVVNKYFKDCFDYIYGHSEFELKPDSASTNNIIKKMGLNKEEVLFVGDSNIDILTAKNALLDVCGCSYGFRSRKELEELNATYIIDNAIELLKYFQTVSDGILLINKPLKLTSQDVLTILKRKLGVDKIGHAGTLDPLATGLLVVLLGSATKLSDYLLSESKNYLCEIIIGKTTPTLDNESEVSEIKKVQENLLIDETLESLVGLHYFKPPIHSAIKVNGRKLYQEARVGKEVEVKDKAMEVYQIKRTSEVIYIDGYAKFSFECLVSKGTYLRTICSEIGKKLNYPAYMNSLVRTKTHHFDLKDAYELDSEEFKVISLVDAIKPSQKVKINETINSRVSNGMNIYLNTELDEVFLVYKNELKGIYVRIKDNLYGAKRVWK